MANTFTNPAWVKSKPHASAEYAVGDSDPSSRTDVLNRPAKGILANLKRVVNALFDGVALDATDQATITGLDLSLTILQALNDFRLVKSGVNLTLERAAGACINIAGTVRKCTTLPTLAGPDTLVDIAGLSRAAACVVTWNGHGLATGDTIYFTGITQADWTALNGNTYSITWIDASTFSIAVNTSGYAADYVPGTDPGKYRVRTAQYVYAYWTGTDVALEASATGYTVDALSGRAQKTGDTSRRLVGMGLCLSDGSWSAGALCTLSHAHRLAKTASAWFTTNRSTGSGTYVELNAEIRVPFLAWPDEAVQIVAVGSMVGSSSGEYVLSSIGVDGTTAEDVQNVAYVNSSVRAPLGVTLTKSAAVGYHYATLLGKIITNACNWYGSATAGERCTLAVTVRG